MENETAVAEVEVAQTDDVVADQVATPAAAVAEAPVAAAEAKPKGKSKPVKERPGLYIQTPPVLRARVESEAAAVGKTVHVYVRDLLAEKYNLELPPVVSRSTYASPEEKKAAQTASRKDKQELVKKLLAEHRAKMAASAAAAAAPVPA